MSPTAPEANISAEDLARINLHFAELEEAMEQNLPNFKNALGTVHSILRGDPEVVALLSPEQLALIVAGGEKALGQYIQAKEVKAKSSKKLTASDF